MHLSFSSSQESESSSAEAQMLLHGYIGIRQMVAIGLMQHAMQVRMSDYNLLKGQVTAGNRRQTGPLAVRDLMGL